MKAAQFFGQTSIKVLNVTEPMPEDNQVLIAIEWCGICGSDLHEYIMGNQTIPKGKPQTMGHEFCGRIKSAPKGSKFSVGQAVVADPRLYCGSCKRCDIQDTVTCPKWGFRGLTGGGGGFSETIAVDEKQVYGVPENLLSYASLIEPLAVAWHAVKIVGLKDFKGKTVLVTGGGPIGIALILVLRQWGAEKIFVSEPTKTRRKQNEGLADEVFNPIEVKVGDECRKRTNGEGVDIVFDAAGVMPGFKDGTDALGFQGWYVNVAIWESEMVVPFGMLMGKELRLTSSRAYNDDDFEETVDAFVKGKFEGFEKMVTGRIQLGDIAKDGFEALVKHKDEHIKILVTPKSELISA